MLKPTQYCAREVIAMSESHLIDHRYTVIEIERMRAATDALMFPMVWDSLGNGPAPGSGGLPGEREKKVEVQLRTYMMAGTRPEELESLILR